MRPRTTSIRLPLPLVQWSVKSSTAHPVAPAATPPATDPSLHHYLVGSVFRALPRPRDGPKALPPLDIEQWLHRHLAEAAAALRTAAVEDDKERQSARDRLATLQTIDINACAGAILPSLRHPPKADSS